MLVSHRYKFIYLKPRKVAGTSVESFLERYCVSPELESTYKINEDTDFKSDEYGIIGGRMKGKGSTKWLNHKSVSEMKRDLPSNIWNEYTKICNIRNPYDMTVSWFHYNRPGNVVNKENFKNFILKTNNLTTLRFNKNIWSDNGKFNFEYIKFENIEEDLDNIMTKLNLPKYNFDLPKYKISRRGEWPQYYDTRSKEIVTSMFEDEINFFNYKF